MNRGHITPWALKTPTEKAAAVTAWVLMLGTITLVVVGLIVTVRFLWGLM